MEKKKFFELVKHGRQAMLTIYGDICSWPLEFLGEVSAVSLSRQLEELGDVDEIQVNINSYGGEVAEGLAIYNALKNHPAKVITQCDGFAASISSVIFMAGDERIMNESSLMMIHMASSGMYGTAADHRKMADDLDVISSASVKAYASHSSLDEETIISMMDEEKWITPEAALEYGFATGIKKVEESYITQSARHSVFEKVVGAPKLEGKVIEPPVAKETEPLKKKEPTQNKEKLSNLLTSIFN